MQASLVRRRRRRAPAAAASRSSAASSSSRPRPPARRPARPARPRTARRRAARAPRRDVAAACPAVHQVGLRERDHARRDLQHLEHRQVLAGLGHHAVVGGDHQQEEVDAGRARRPSCARSARGRERPRRSAAGPTGSSSGAKPSSIEMPRSRSCGRRSVSTPVSASTSTVLPWSM